MWLLFYKLFNILKLNYFFSTFLGENEKMIVRKVYKDILNRYCKNKLKSYSIV